MTRKLLTDDEDDIYANTNHEMAPCIEIDRELFEIDINEIKITNEVFSGGGSGAIVLRGTWNGTDIALKLFRTTNFTGQIDIEDFQTELQLLGSLRYPSIVAFYGACLAPNRIGLVLEWCENGSLASFIQKNKGRMTYMRKLELLLDVAKAMNLYVNLPVPRHFSIC